MFKGKFVYIVNKQVINILTTIEEYHTIQRLKEGLLIRNLDKLEKCLRHYKNLRNAVHLCRPL